MWIELKDIHKHYGAVKANNGVSFTVKEGSIHGILGENGAGKSTLMKIISGYIRKTSGSIRVNGTTVDINTPADAVGLGIGMLYQDPMDFPQLTVLENFMLGQVSGINSNVSEIKQRFIDLSSSLGFDIDPLSIVSSLTVGERQQLEIIRLLEKGIDVLILDEPTTGISSLQKETLFKGLLKLAAEGKSVILVSHKLEDVDILCDRITVLQEGTVTGEMEKPFDTGEILKMMFAQLPPSPTRANVTPGNVLLEMEKISAIGGRTGLHDCSVKIREGEVVGLAGLEGSGQGVFLRLATGIKPSYNGRISLGNTPATKKDFVFFQKRGVTFLPTSRLEEGLVSGMDISEHCILNEDSSSFFINRKRALGQALSSISKFKIKGRSNSLVESLSGGNQQRLLLSFLPEKPRLLLLENPTRGLDLESAAWVWEYLHRFSKTYNSSIVFSSSELDEILMVADRVLVFFDGRIIKDVRSDETDINELGRAIAGKV